jgi:hypothetical protein
MNANTHAATASDTRHPRPHSRLFPVTLGRYDAPHDLALIQDLVDWAEATYRADMAQRPSKHVYIRHLPAEVQAQVDVLRDHAAIRAAIFSRLPAHWVITPMKHTDELYLSHYNKDKGGDQGLFDKHYDGNLRFIPFGCVVRALIYLQSDDTYTVVFADSGVRKAFTDHEFGVLDFHRELHWVEGEYRAEDRQRILLKCNYLVAPPGLGSATRAVLAANTAVFYVVKAAMEYSKSPKTPAQKVVGFLCNLMRTLNNIHPLIPLALVAAVGAAMVGALMVGAAAMG